VALSNFFTDLLTKGRNLKESPFWEVIKLGKEL